ncbi:peptidase domain-containing ABC transporter [Pelobium sp.]|nr:peptidase domain-containing ABC transporter [Pelobium sp.]MDA9555154.1 peptidase domain-containing ABC transporter [Pelobium sp.]
MKKFKKQIKRTFTKQQDQSDCGVACLLSIIKFHGGLFNLEKLRELSGTTKQGTTLLGLFQCSNSLGLKAEGFEAEIKHLKDLPEPCILHVRLEQNLEHYLVCYGISPTNEFIIGDPAKGIIYLTEEELDKIWLSKTLLTLKPTRSFVKIKNQNKEKLSWFLNLIKEDYPILGISIFLGIIISVLGLATAIFSQKLIDDILPKSKTQTLIIGLICLLLLLLVKAVLNYLRQHFLLQQTKDFNTRIASNFYDDLLSLPKSFFDHRKTGDMIARMNDTMRIQKSIVYITGSFFIDFIVVLISSIFLFIYSWEIAVIALTCIPIMVLVVYKYHQPIVRGQQQVMAAYAHNESNYVDTIQAIDTIKVANKESFFSRITKTVYVFFQEQSFNLGKKGNQFGLLTELFSTIIIISVIAYASFQVFQKQLTMGEMIALMTISSSLLPAITRLTLTNLQIQEARVALDRMYEFVSIKPEYNSNDVAQEAIVFHSLSIENISFRFPGRKSILNSISLTIDRGEIIALLGESGCGKSTFLQIIQKFYDFENGRICLNDKDFKEIAIPTWRNCIATVPQDIKIFSGTLLYNVILEDKIDDLEVFHKFCVANGFDKYFLELPQGYFTLIGEEGINLSGGQKQLVAIARALYKKPQFLILDEVTSAMDRNTENFILNLLKKLRDKITVLIVTHKFYTAKIADKIYLIENGVSKSLGDPEILMKEESIYTLKLTS